MTNPIKTDAAESKALRPLDLDCPRCGIDHGSDLCSCKACGNANAILGEWREEPGSGKGTEFVRACRDCGTLEGEQLAKPEPAAIVEPVTSPVVAGPVSHALVSTGGVERLWSYVQSCGIDMQSMSTDACVDRNRAKLEAAREAAPTEELRRDLYHILRRGTAARVKTDAEKLADANRTISAQRSGRKLLGGVTEELSCGAMIHFAGQGALTVPLMAKIFEDAGLDVEVPKGKGIKHHVSVALKQFKTNETKVRSESSKERAADATHTARWFVSSVNHSTEIGLPSGSTILDVRIDGGVHSIQACDSDACQAMAAQLEAAINLAIDSERLTCDEVRGWLSGFLVESLCVKMGGNWYAPKEKRSEVLAVCKALELHWGQWAISPRNPIEMADSDSLLDSVAYGIKAQIEDERAAHERIAKAYSKRTDKAGNPVAIGGKALTSRIAKINAIAERAKALQSWLGEERLADLAREACKLADEITEGCSATEIRGALVWDEIARG